MVWYCRLSLEKIHLHWEACCTKLNIVYPFWTMKSQSYWWEISWRRKWRTNNGELNCSTQLNISGELQIHHEYVLQVEYPSPWSLHACHELRKADCNNKWSYRLFGRIRVFKQMGEVSFGTLLQSQKRLSLPSQWHLWRVELLANLTHLKWMNCMHKMPSNNTNRANGNLRIKRSVLRWNLRISRSATVPGRNLCLFAGPTGCAIISWAAGL